MMNQWMPQTSPSAAVDLDVLDESSLAVAQATIQNAMDEAHLKSARLAEKMGRPRSYVSRMLSGRHNLTVKTFSRALAACGFRLQFTYVPLEWGWTSETPVVEQNHQHSAHGVGTLMPAVAQT
jgi:transcriptional regulator with XRE-family HTH domain